MLCCPQLRSTPLRYVSSCTARACLGIRTCIDVRTPSRQQPFSTSDPSPHSEGSAETGVDINIETDLDHIGPSITDASTPVLNPALPSPTNASHHDLASFVAYARRTGLSTVSTTYRGTYYEYLTALTLRRYGFELVKVGGRGDKGVDLVGTWTIPNSVGNASGEASNGGNDSPMVAPAVTNPMPTQQLRVLVQCKRMSGKSKLGPNFIRELEGAMRGVNVPIGWRGPGVLGIMVGPRGATKGVRDAMADTRRAMGWVMLEVEEHRISGDIEEAEEEDAALEEEPVCKEGDHVGKVRQILWNKAASTLGLEGVKVVTWYNALAKPQDTNGQESLSKEVMLMSQGKILPGLDEKNA